jgi:hypothetical protein
MEVLGVFCWLLLLLPKRQLVCVRLIQFPS